MKTLSKQTRFENFCADIEKNFPEYSNSITDFIFDIEIYETDNHGYDFSTLFTYLLDRNFFEIDVIYYHDAIEYLKENDPSLRESLEIAEEFGYQTKDLNSEILSSLLASRNFQTYFVSLENDFNEFFATL